MTFSRTFSRLKIVVATCIVAAPALAGGANAVLKPADGGTGLMSLGSGVPSALGAAAGAAGGFALFSQLGSGAFASAYTLPAATATVLGGVKPDGTTIGNIAGVISVTYGTTSGTAAQGNDSRITGAAQKANNLGDLASVSTARTNLGLSALATTVPGTGVQAALQVSIDASGGLVGYSGALGTPTQVNLANATGLPLSTGVIGVLQAAQEPAHMGDVTNTAGSLALAIANGAVTSAKMASGAAAANLGNGGVTSSMLASGAAASNLSADGPIFFAKAYGSCTWTSAGDVGPCINSAIAAAASAGGGEVRIPAGLYGLSTAIVQNTSGVSLKGQGVGDPRSNLSPSNFRAQTRLLWLGAAAATMYDEEPASGSTNTLSSASVTGIVFDCNNIAAICAKISQVSHSIIDIGAAEPTSIGVYLTTNTGTDSPGTQNNDIWISSRQTSTTATATGILIDGGSGSTWNVSYNRFHKLYAWYGAGDGIVFGNSDNNLIEDIGTFKQPSVSVYGRSCVMANTGYTSPNGIVATSYAYDNVVRHNACNDMKVFGPASSGFARNIMVEYTDTANSVPDPVFDTYSTGFYGRTGSPWLKTGGTSQPAFQAGTGSATAPYAVAIGSNAGASSNFSFAFGAGVSASNWNSFAMGQNSTADGFYSWSRGANAHARGRYGADCFASGRFVATPDAQGCKFVLRGTTSSTSAVALTTDGAARGSANCVNIPTNAAYSLRVTVQAFDHTTPANAETWSGWAMMLTRGSGNAALVTASTPTPLTTGAVTGSAIAAAADTTNQCLNLNFTPPTSNTDTWNIVATVESVEAQ